MDICHAETADTCRLIRQSFFMGVKAEVDDVADAQCVDISQLRFGRLAGRGQPIVKSTPVVDRFRVGHETPSSLEFSVHSSIFGFGGGARRGTLLIGADILPRKSKPARPRASRAFDVAFPDRRASFSSLVSSMPISFTRRRPQPPHSARRSRKRSSRKPTRCGRLWPSRPTTMSLPLRVGATALSYRDIQAVKNERKHLQCPNRTRWR